MTKIHTLTPEQEAKLPKYLDKYMNYGYRTTPMDQVLVEDLIAKLYSDWLDKEKPIIVYCQSPFQMSVYPGIYKELGKIDTLDCLKANLGNNLRNNLGNNLWNNLWNNLENNLRNNLRNNLGNNLRNNLENNLRNNLENNLRNNLGNNLWNNLWNNLRNNLENNLRNNLENNLRNNLGNNLWNNLWNNLENNLRNNLRNNLGNNLWNNLWNNLENNLRNNLWNNLYLNWWWNYRVVYDFVFSELLPFPPGTEEGFRFIEKIFSEVHAISVYDGICFVSDFPTKLKVNEQARLHSLEGAALEYADGFSLYAVNGVMIDQSKTHIITAPETITIEEIELEQNAEIRRVMVEIYGLEKYLSNAEKIHEDDFGVLYKKAMAGTDEPLVVVKVVNATPEPDGSFKDYFIRVPPTVTRAKEAVAWTFNKTEQEYMPCVQT